MAPSITITAESATIRVRQVSSEKFWWLRVPRILTQEPICWSCITELVTEIPRWHSISIRSLVAALTCLPFTFLAWAMAPPYPPIEEKFFRHRGER